MARKHKVTGTNVGMVIGSGASSRYKLHAKTLVLLILPLLLAAGLVFGAVQVFKKPANRGSATAQGSVCSRDVIVKASAAIKTNNMPDMVKIQKEVKALNGHESDPNCEFILTKIALLQTDPGDARKQLTLLKKVYTQYSPSFTIQTQNPGQLEPSVEFAEKFIKQFTSNAGKSSAVEDAAGDALINGSKQ